jgi:hypothetical protein
VLRVWAKTLKAVNLNPSQILSVDSMDYASTNNDSKPLRGVKMPKNKMFFKFDFTLHCK